MIYPPIGELLEKTGTRYSLVILTAKRARQLASDENGAFAGSFDEAILEAVDEIYHGKVQAAARININDEYAPRIKKDYSRDDTENIGTDSGMQS